MTNSPLAPDDLPRLTAAPSIYEFLAARLDPAGRLAEPVDLPDEPVVWNGLSWVAGARDGVLGHHADDHATDAGAAEIAEQLADAVREPTVEHLRRLRDGLAGAPAGPALVDAVLEQLAERGTEVAGLRRVARWLATTATERFAVKVGTALLGRLGLAPGDLGVIRTLGAHEELTLYAAGALTDGLPNPDTELWALAAAVDGWGRIECVERLRHTTDPAIRRWMLRVGYRNSVMDVYLAHTAATTGGLTTALAVARTSTEVDRELLTAAGEILEALIEGGPARDIDDYADAAEAVALFLELMSRQASTPADFLAVCAIRDFLNGTDGWHDRLARGWTDAHRTACLELVGRVLSAPDWVDQAEVGLHAESFEGFHSAVRMAREVGVDPFPQLVARIEADPLGSWWYEAWQGAAREQAHVLADLATRLLPLDDIAGGPALELGLGPSWRHHSTLDWSLHGLRHHPGTGGALLCAGLRSPVQRNRNAALTALSEWPRALWPVEAVDAVAHLAALDPDERIRARAADLRRSSSTP